MNASETILTPFNVNSTSFGKIGVLPTDGRVRVEPLYVGGQTINGGKHNVIYVGTEHDTMYAYDADNGSLLWQKSALLTNEVPADFGLTCDVFLPEVGITATPVIDRTQTPNGAIYFLSTTKSLVDSSYHYRLNALDLATGEPLFGGPVEITAHYPGVGDDSDGGQVHFKPGHYIARAGLLESKGSIYIAFAGLCDRRPYTGWVMQYSASTLQQLSVLDLAPNGYQAGVWQSGAGLAADSDGYVYVLVGNGSFDTALDRNGFPLLGDYGNAFVKISGTAPMTVVDYFTMYNTEDESDKDKDLGSGGPMVIDIPNGQPFGEFHLALGAGKDGHIYVADRNNMGKWNPLNNNALHQDMWGTMKAVFSSPAYFNNTVYFGPPWGAVQAFPVREGYLQSPSSHSANVYNFPGGSPSISSNGTTNGIVWTVNDAEKTINPATLYAYDALNLGHELYDSNQNLNRDSLGVGNRFVTPMIANGKVYVSTWKGVYVFGLLSQRSQFMIH